MSAHVQSLALAGAGAIVITIECHVSNNLPNIVIVGFANKAVNEARERLRGAFAASRLQLPRKRITINLAPADLPKVDSGFDLGIAAAILAADDQISCSLTAEQVFIGELGLDGRVHGVHGIIGKLLAGRMRGITTFFIPTANLQQARLVPDITLIAISTLTELWQHLNPSSSPPAPRIHTTEVDTQIPRQRRTITTTLADIAGQAQAKRALEIAAAGGHNVLLSGPPGTGKSMLAKALPSILPPLSHEETLEVTHLHSLASYDYERVITERPFRAPHHAASQMAVIGGSRLKPGEISLAHRGVLFLDEIPEFNRPTLEALRQPLEDRVISITRVGGSVEFPANFILIATANPCPCGYYGTTGSCTCEPAQIQRYQRKLSGPIMDRIDLYSDVHAVDHGALLTRTDSDDDTTQQRVAQARRLQATRFKQPSKLNADMTNDDIKQAARLEPDATSLLNTAADRIKLSARVYMRTIKVARTIADLEASDQITVGHVSEALTYRRPQPLL